MQGVCFHSFHWTVVQVGKWREDETKRWTKGPYLITHNALKNWKIVKFTEKSICLLLSQKDKIIDIFCEIFFWILKYYLLLSMVLIFELLHDCTIFSADLVPKQLTTRVATQRRLFDMIIWHFVDWFAKIRAQYFYFSCFWKLLILKYLLLFYIWTIIA